MFLQSAPINHSCNITNFTVDGKALEYNMRQIFWSKASRLLERFQLSDPETLPICLTSQTVECSTSSNESLITCSENFLNDEQGINVSFAVENNHFNSINGQDNLGRSDEIFSVISTASDLKDVEYSYDYNNELPISEDESLEDNNSILNDAPFLLFSDEIITLIDSMILVLANPNIPITEISNIRVEERANVES